VSLEYTRPPPDFKSEISNLRSSRLAITKIGRQSGAVHDAVVRLIAPPINSGTPKNALVRLIKVCNSRLRVNFQSPAEVLGEVVAIFPEFKREWENENAYIREDGSYSIHSVYMVFLEFLSCKKTANSADQLKQIATLINGAVAAGGDSENAISTCLLEHLKQVGLDSVLKPFMSSEARRRLTA